VKKTVFASTAALGLVGALLMLTSSVVFAHSRPIRFDPAPGAVLQSAPAQITGWFNADLRRDPNWNFIKVTDDKGTQVDTGDVQLSTDRRQMSVALKPGLGPGRYLVTWRTFDDGDGAIFGDCYAFFVGQAAADASLAANTRLDGGGACQRIDVSARNGTPVPGVTPTVAAAPGDAGDDHEAATGGDNGGGSDVPIWGLVVGIAGGLAAGAVGTKMISRS
jgi:methionine-rich copper-binding protein CopC